MNAIIVKFDLSNARIIKDDDEARAYLLRDGVLSGLVPQPPYDTISATYRNDDGFVYTSRSCVPGDSGYTVVILPEAHYNPLAAAYIIAALQAHDNKAPGTERGYLVECENSQN